MHGRHFNFHFLRNEGGIRYYSVLVAIRSKCAKQYVIMCDVSFSPLFIFNVSLIWNAQINFHFPTQLQKQTANVYTVYTHVLCSFDWMCMYINCKNVGKLTGEKRVQTNDTPSHNLRFKWFIHSYTERITSSMDCEIFFFTNIHERPCTHFHTDWIFVYAFILSSCFWSYHTTHSNLEN